AAYYPPGDKAAPMALLALKFGPLFLPVAAAAAIGWIGLLDLDRRSERYRAMAAVLAGSKEQLETAATPAILRSRVARVERLLLQEVVEWHARMRHHRAG